MNSPRFRAVRPRKLRNQTAIARGKRVPKGMTIAGLILFCILGFYQFLAFQFRPPIEVAAKAVALRAATIALNEALSEEISHDADYEKIVHIDRMPDGSIEAARFDFSSITKLQAAATSRAQAELSRLEKTTLQLPIGSVIGGSLFGAIGPRLPVRLYVVGTAKSSITTEVKTEGINQTVHILYLDISADVTVIAPFTTAPLTVDARTPIAYIVFEGQVPKIYNKTF